MSLPSNCLRIVRSSNLSPRRSHGVFVRAEDFHVSSWLDGHGRFLIKATPGPLPVLIRHVRDIGKRDSFEAGALLDFRASPATAITGPITQKSLNFRA